MEYCTSDAVDEEASSLVDMVAGRSLEGAVGSGVVVLPAGKGGVSVDDGVVLVLVVVSLDGGV